MDFFPLNLSSQSNVDRRLCIHVIHMAYSRFSLFLVVFLSFRLFLFCVFASLSLLFSVFACILEKEIVPASYNCL